MATRRPVLVFAASETSPKPPLPSRDTSLYFPPSVTPSRDPLSSGSVASFIAGGEYATMGLQV